jgi:hypothetical protein
MRLRLIFVSAALVAVLAPAHAGADARAPAVTRIDPSAGRAGTVVTVTGSGFRGASGVTFNRAPASFAIESDRRIRTTVPLGATSGPITVTTSGGAATSTSQFRLTWPDPAVSLSPTVGPPTTSIAVAGEGFGRFEAVDVYFDTTDMALASTKGSASSAASRSTCRPPPFPGRTG